MASTLALAHRTAYGVALLPAPDGEHRGKYPIRSRHWHHGRVTAPAYWAILAEQLTSPISVGSSRVDRRLRQHRPRTHRL